MSMYVKRCHGDYCGRRVQGLTSFRLIGKAKRSDECRFCEAQAKADGFSPSKKRHLRTLLRDEQLLTQRLAHVRSLIASRNAKQQGGLGVSSTFVDS